MRSSLYQERLARTGVWTLEDRWVRADLDEVYKIINGVLLVSFNMFLNFLTVLAPEDIG